MPPDLMHITAQLLTAFLLLFGRVLGMFAAFPMFGERNVPWQARIGIAFFMTLLLLPTTTAHQPLPATDLVMLGLGFIRELLVGLSIAYLARLLFGAFQFAVNALDFQSGLSFVQVVNPGSDTSLSVMGQFLNTLMMLMFLELDGHHLIIRALGASLRAAPLGYAAPPLPTAELVARMFSSFVQFGLQLVMPAVLLLTLVDIAMGIVGRVVPQLNVFMVALPIKIMVMIVTLSLTLPVMSDIMTRLLGIMGEGLNAYVGMMG
ncbi:MAG: flagellar biosynthetic protein FliR [Armatimonadetes bacterium]|nr:flagellar biosynthetic protein FliR [Armatimonadota bacterium]